jgi:hypothetical protein
MTMPVPQRWQVRARLAIAFVRRVAWAFGIPSFQPQAGLQHCVCRFAVLKASSHTAQVF